VLFYIAPYTSRLRDVHISQYSLIIEAVRYRASSVRVPINVTRFYNMMGTRRYEAESTVTEAFLGMLALKSGELTPESIVGISPEIRNSDLINDVFAPTEHEGRAMYTASVATGDLISHHDYIAIIETTWVVGLGRDMQYFNETFRVTARSTDSIWAIVDVVRL
jgi:hypothetical protein